MKGPRPTNTQSRGMRDGTTRYATGTPCLVKEPRGHAIASCERHRLMTGAISDSGVSPIIAELLFLAITLLLAAIIAAVVFGLIPSPVVEEEPPEILKIVSISHGEIRKLESIIRLRNVGHEDIETCAHGAYLSINGVREKAAIESLNTEELIKLQHYDVRYWKGAGPRDDFWKSGDLGILDVENGRIRPGDLVTIEVYEKKSGKIISRSEMYAPAVF